MADSGRFDFPKRLHGAPSRISAHIAIANGLIKCGLQDCESPVGRGLPLANGVIGCRCFTGPGGLALLAANVPWARCYLISPSRQLLAGEFSNRDSPKTRTNERSRTLFG